MVLGFYDNKAENCNY